MSFTREDLEKSEKTVGQIYPVLKDKKGNIIDGFHRKRVNPNWKEEVLDVDDPLDVLKIRVATQYRRNVPPEEKKTWVNDCRKLLQAQNKAGTQKEIAEVFGLSIQWVSKYDDEPIQPNKEHKVPRCGTFPDSNVWGLEDGKVAKGDPKQPDSQFYHGTTPSFVVENLVEMYKPEKVLDTMAGVGTTKYACEKKPEIVKKVDQFDIYAWPKGCVQEGDAENPPTNEKYNLIFNHIPYLNMVKYGEDSEDMSNFNLNNFLGKMRRIFERNFSLLQDDGKYSILVGDWRYKGQIIPLTAHLTLLGLQCGFTLWDEAIKLSAEQKGKQLQEYRANKSGYLPQNYDTVLIFKKGKA
jgi:hypothetical protein